MIPLILVFNCGSSSIKFALLNPVHGLTLLTGLIEKLGTDEAALSYKQEEKKTQLVLGKIDYNSAFQKIVALMHNTIPQDAHLLAIGHRVVHGGNYFCESVVIDQAVLQSIEACIPLAPLHNPANLSGIKAASLAFPGVPQIAVFDTAFHQTLPEHAFLYALPYQYYHDYHVRRYGFHGISYHYLTLKAAELLKKPVKQTSLILAHLGNGCSICAVKQGKSVDTSMGLTPLEGLVMGTRSGDIDPGLFAYLTEKLNISLTELTHILNKQSGLLGISELSMDMRMLESAANQGNVKAQLAIEIFCYRLAKYIAAMMVPLGKIDALVFSGGIGENAVLIRAKTLLQLEFLGFTLDLERNKEHGKMVNGCIVADNSTPALVIATNEELMIAQDAYMLVN